MEHWWDKWLRALLKFCCDESEVYDPSNAFTYTYYAPKVYMFRSELERERLTGQKPTVFHSATKESQHGTLHTVDSYDA